MDRRTRRLIAKVSNTIVDILINKEYMATGESPSSKNERNGIPLGLLETTIRVYK